MTGNHAWFLGSILLLSFAAARALEEAAPMNPRLRRRAALIKVSDITKEERQQEEDIRERTFLEGIFEDADFWGRKLEQSSMSIMEGLRRDLDIVGSMSMNVRRLPGTDKAVTSVTERKNKSNLDQPFLESSFVGSDEWIRELDLGSMSMDGFRRELDMGSMSMNVRRLPSNI